MAVAALANSSSTDPLRPGPPPAETASSSLRKEDSSEPSRPSIHLYDVLRLIHEKVPGSGKPAVFSLKHYTYNRRSHEGGRLVEVPEAVALTEAALANPRSYTERRASRRAKSEDPHARHRPGDHWRNATRDLMLPTGEVHRVIIWLITEFNGMIVRY